MLILYLKINGMLLSKPKSAFIKTEIVFRTFVPRRFLATWGFLAFYIDLRTSEIEGKHKPAKHSVC